LRAATHLLGDADEAGDAVQDSFVRAYRHLGSYREQDRFGAWLLHIVVNGAGPARRASRATPVSTNAGARRR
jgi:RNA polymerase sigma-70 factor (ECF subfamily)